MMLTTEPPSFTKIETLTSRALLLFAGSVPDGEEVKDRVRAAVAVAPDQTIVAMAEAVRSAYESLKRKRVEEQILRPFLGTDFSGFQQMVTQTSASQVLQQVLGIITQHNLQLDLLLVGHDDGHGAQLFAISHPGQALPMGATGFAAIGSGALHAGIKLSLSEQTPKKSLAETVYNVYEAKRAAEVSPGVGKMTDMTILSSGKIVALGDPVLKILAKMHKEHPSLNSKELEKLKKAL